MATQVIYVLDTTEGETVEAKAYQVIWEGYQATGRMIGIDDVIDKFRITAATRVGDLQTCEIEWEVKIEGEDNDIKEYQGILKQME